MKQFNKDFSETDLLDLRTPDGWTMLRSVFEERGYDVSPTAKSRTALGQLALLGGVENLKVAASSKVHGLLKELSLGRGEDRAFVSDRRTEPIGRFDKEWGRKSGRDLLGWLIGRRLLFRGTNIKCPRCELKRWYEVDRIGETWRCDGCKEDMPIPLQPQSITWRYKINELYAHGLDQGTLTPLLTLHAMHLAWGTSSIHGGLGFYPCVELKAKGGADVPFDKKEIDLVAMRGRELILAECKESAKPFSQPGEATSFARQLGDLVVLAEHLGASRVLAASPTQFPDDKGVLLATVPADGSVDVDWLDDHDLLDPQHLPAPPKPPDGDRRARRQAGGVGNRLPRLGQKERYRTNRLSTCVTRGPADARPGGEGGPSARRLRPPGRDRGKQPGVSAVPRKGRLPGAGPQGRGGSAVRARPFAIAYVSPPRRRRGTSLNLHHKFTEAGERLQVEAGPRTLRSPPPASASAPSALSRCLHRTSGTPAFRFLPLWTSKSRHPQNPKSASTT